MMLMETATIRVLLRGQTLDLLSSCYGHFIGAKSTLTSNLALVAATTSVILCVAVTLLQLWISRQEEQCRLLQIREEKDLVAASARSLQSAWRGLMQRRTNRLRRDACNIIQKRARGILVRSILSGQRLLAVDILQDNESDKQHGVQQAFATEKLSTEKEKTGTNNGTKSGNMLKRNICSTLHKDCHNLIAAFNKDPTGMIQMVAKDATRTAKQTQQEPTFRKKNSNQFALQVKGVMEMRMRLLASVVLQSWVRMLTCQRAYRKVFSSLSTAPITNVPSLGPPPASAQPQDTQETFSFISSLSSWSSTWNRRQSKNPVPADKKKDPTTTAAPESKAQEENETNERTKEIISAIVMATSTTCKDKEEENDGIPKGKRRRRGRAPSGYYSELWKSTLESVGECNTMCESVEMKGASSLNCHKPACRPMSADCSEEGNYEIVWTRRTGEGINKPSCNVFPSLCTTMSAPTATTKIMKRVAKAATRCNSMTDDETHQSNREISPTKPLIKVGLSACNNPAIYYVPTADDDAVEDTTGQYRNHVGTEPTFSAIHTSSFPTNDYTFSSPSTYTDEETQTTAQHQEAAANGLNFAFCTAPPVATSLTSSSGSGSSSAGSSYYSMDDTDLLDEGPSLSYEGPHPAGVSRFVEYRTL